MLETDRTTIYCIFLLQWFPYWAKAKVPAKYCCIEFDQTSLQVATVLSLMPLLLWICFIAGTDCIIACPSTSRALYVRGQGVCAKTVSRPHELNSRVSTHRTSRKVYFVLCNLRGTPNMYFIFYKNLMVPHFSQDEKAKISCLQLLHKDKALISSTWGIINMNIRIVHLKKQGKWEFED